MTLKFYTGVAKGSKLKVRKFWELIATFIEVTGGKLEGEGGGGGGGGGGGWWGVLFTSHPE